MTHELTSQQPSLYARQTEILAGEHQHHFSATHQLTTIGQAIENHKFAQLPIGVIYAGDSGSFDIVPHLVGCPITEIGANNTAISHYDVHRVSFPPDKPILLPINPSELR
jgi:hypothetical protein